MAAFSHPGASKSTNEDRVSYYISEEPMEYEEELTSGLEVHSHKRSLTGRSKEKSVIDFNFFGVFDGHTGQFSSSYLAENFHLRLMDSIADRSADDSITQIIEQTCHEVDQELLSKLPSNDHSGSCALFLFSYLDKVYLANVGDSRALICKSLEQLPEYITTQHRPENTAESSRVLSRGAQIFRNTKMRNWSRQESPVFLNRMGISSQPPLRLFPNGISVTRSFGDKSCKSQCPSPLIVSPDVLEIKDDFDYILLVSDGVSDRLQPEQIHNIVLSQLDAQHNNLDSAATEILQRIYQLLINQYCSDNISVVFLMGQRFRPLLSTSME